MSAALRLDAPTRPQPFPAPDRDRPDHSQTDPFPGRITCGSDPTASALRSHAASARRDMEREAARVRSGADEDGPTARAEQAARKYRAAAREARAFDRLAELHERREMPSPLFTVRTRRHVRTLLAAETFTPAVDAALKTALRWTRGLPMRRRTGFGLMREGFERLGLLAPVVLPLAVARALRPDGAAPSGDSLPADPQAVVVEVAEATAEARPATVEAYVEGATARAAEGWTGHVTQFSEIDFAEAFERGLSLPHAIEAARDWITGAVVFGPLPFAWGEADGTGRPFQRDERGRLRPSADHGPADGPPVEDDDPEPTGGGGEGAPDAPTPEDRETQDHPAPTPADLARADKLDGQAETAERKADHQRDLHAGQNLTRRRAQARAAGMREAERLTVYATALRAVAAAIRAGTCPPVLSGITTRAHVERLVGVPSGPEARMTTPSYPEDGPAPHDWQNTDREKRRRAFACMGIESGEQFKRAVAALAALIDGHESTDPDAAEREAQAEAARVERMVEAARLAGIPDYFRTPPRLVETVLASSGLYGTGRGARVLEPSAGDGAILDALRERYPEARVDAVEPNHRLAAIIRAKGHPEPFVRRFEHFEPSEPYDLVLMNPPFGRGGAVAMDHVERAASMLRPGGRLVSFVPESVVFRTDRRHAAFRAFVDEHGGHYIDVEAGAFEDTGVKTRIVVLDV